MFNETTKGMNQFEIMQFWWKLGQEFGEMKTKMDALMKENAELKERLGMNC
jgi:hypothetical protein